MVEGQWENFFVTAFREIKDGLTKRYQLQMDGSGHPEFVAIRKGVERFPPSVKILELKVDRNKFDHLKDDYCPILTYDFESTAFYVRYLGRVDPSEPSFIQILKDEFRVVDPDFARRFTEDFRTIALFEDNGVHLQFLYYDPRKDLSQYVWDFINHLFDSHFSKEFAKKFDDTPDFNQIYALKPDAILPEEELLTKYSHMGSFVKMDEKGVKKIILKDLQENIANVRLIPNVNEDVARVFDRAKKLYIFGWYVYEFFPIANHYAALTLESAIRHKYYVHFGRNVKIRNKKGQEAIFAEVEHNRIMQFCEEHGWDRNNIEINGERFLYGMNSILDWLVKNKIITMWDKIMCKHILDIRNYLSHQTFAPTYPAGYPYRTLRQVAFLINKMFHN